MNTLGGRVGLSGRLAYVSQQAWVMNASLRSNITFVKPYDESLYRKGTPPETAPDCTAVDVACLSSDIEVLPAGDLTEIGKICSTQLTRR